MKGQCSKDFTITTIMHVVFDSLFENTCCEKFVENILNHFVS